MSSHKNPQIFFSYSRQDYDLVARVHDDLTRRGKSIWMDRQSISLNTEWLNEIEKGLSTCEQMVLFLSNDALASDMVKHEYTRFAELHGNKSIIPVFARKVTEPVPEMLARVQWLTEDLHDNYKQAINKLTKALKSVKHILPREMILIPGGSFKRGLPGHEETVDLPEFWISKYPVTVAEFLCFADHEGTEHIEFMSSEMPQTHLSFHRDTSTWLTNNQELVDYASSYPERPMAGVSLTQAIAYCNFLNTLSNQPGKYTLQTASQWEKAATGTDGRRYPWGNEWYDEAAVNISWNRNTPDDVDTLPEDFASPYGCVGMAGNIWEWTGSTPKDDDARSPVQWYAPYVIKGGSWLSGRSHMWNYARAVEIIAPREDLTVGRRYISQIGFRLVATYHSDPDE